MPFSFQRSGNFISISRYQTVTWLYDSICQQTAATLTLNNLHLRWYLQRDAHIDSLTLWLAAWPITAHSTCLLCCRISPSARVGRSAWRLLRCYRHRVLREPRYLHLSTVIMVTMIITVISSISPSRRVTNFPLYAFRLSNSSLALQLFATLCHHTPPKALNCVPTSTYRFQWLKNSALRQCHSSLIIIISMKWISYLMGNQILYSRFYPFKA